MHPLTARLLTEIATTGTLSRSSWREFIDGMDELSQDELRQICTALGMARFEQRARTGEAARLEAA